MLQGRRTKTRTHPHQGSQGAAHAQENETFQGYKVGDEVEIVESAYGDYIGVVGKVLAIGPHWVDVDVNPSFHKHGLSFYFRQVRSTKEAKVLKILRQWKATR